MDKNDPLLPWFFIKGAPGLGNILFRRLLENLRTPEAILKAGEKALKQAAGLPEKTSAYLLAKQVPDEVKQEIDAVRASCAKVATFSDDSYPALLRQIPDPPPYLYYYGDIGAVSKAVALVGSRDPSRYGLDVTRRMAKDLAEAGVTVVSGGARGIDTAAHEGALEGKGKTVAVLGCGLSVVYPPENRDLFAEIIKDGAVISEFPMNAKPESWHFPPRNRIISGISAAVVVVEAAARSGSLITARMALEQNREVFAVPGSVASPKSAGTHQLIRQGACLVESARDVLDVLEPIFGHIETALGATDAATPKAAPPLPEDEALVYAALESWPIHVDEISRKVKMDAGSLSGILLSLELQGLASQSPGKLFSRGDK